MYKSSNFEKKKILFLDWTMTSEENGLTKFKPFMRFDYPMTFCEIIKVNKNKNNKDNFGHHFNSSDKIILYWIFNVFVNHGRLLYKLCYKGFKFDFKKN
jgi:hypothetical protein